MPAEATVDAAQGLDTMRGDVVALATVASLARRIEPELLRALRLGLAERFAPTSRPHVGTEAALWFSPIVESRGPDSITLTSHVSRLLQDRLATNGELLEAARAVIEDCHRDMPAVLRWEEEVVYLALTSTLTEIARQRRIREAARQAYDAISTNNRPGLEDRVREMWTRLPPLATTNSFLANVHQICDRNALERRGERAERSDEPLQTVPLQVRKLGDVWHLGHLDDADLTIQVPALEPITLDVLKSVRSKRVVRTLIIRGDHRAEVAVGNAPLVVRTIDGRVYSLTPELVEPSLSAPIEPGEDAVPMNEARVILLGSGGAGKTSLVSRLVRGTWSPESSATHGIAISEWRLPLHGSETARVNFWDFGGQEIQTGITERFFSARAVYLVVLRGRGDSDYEAELWLSRLAAYAGDAPVVVALNESGSRRHEVDRARLLKKYPNIKTFVDTDAQTGRGTDALAAALRDAIASLPHLGSMWARSWLAVRDDLSQTARNYIALSEFRGLCARHGVTTEDQQNALATYLHDLGIILYFADELRPRPIVVLHPEWIANGIYRLIESGFTRTPPWELHLKDVARTLDNDQYPRPVHEFILRLMERFELCFRFPPPRAETYLIPQLLEFAQPPLDDFSISDCLNFQYSYSTWFDSLIARFIARTHFMCEEKRRWHHGVVLKSGATRALVRADPNRQTVTVSVDGPPDSRKALLDVARSHFDAIHNQMPYLGVRALVPLPRDPSVTVPHTLLLRRLETGLNTVSDPETGEDIDIHELLGDVTVEPTRSVPEASARVLVCYSHEDERSLKELSALLTPLERQAVIEFWDDTRIVDKQLFGAVDRAEVIVFLVTQSFLRSRFVRDAFVSRALERDREGFAHAVAVIVGPCDWERFLREVQVFPRDGKAIISLPLARRTAAWAQAAREIARVADECRAARSRSNPRA
jgi:internalin A